MSKSGETKYRAVRDYHLYDGEDELDNEDTYREYRKKQKQKEKERERNRNVKGAVNANV